MGYIAPKPTVNAGTVVAAQSVAVGTAAASLSSLNIQTNLVALQVQSNDVYVTFDGSTPSASNGGQMFSGQSYHWSPRTALNAKFVQQSASATIFAQECVTSFDQSEMPYLEVLKPRLTAF